MSEKGRLDALLVSRGLVESRELARSVIMAGHVLVDGDREDKPGRMVAADAAIEVKNYEKKYVSRGGYKLERAIEAFGLDLKAAVCIDGGASTGGFTDCMLQNGAARVYAVDVGYGQLAWSLRSDPRVVCMERTNLRYLTSAQIPEPVDFVSVDVSFISLALVMPPLVALLREGGGAVALIKPQFEAGREKVGKKGVVRDPGTHIEVIRKIVALAPQWDVKVAGLTFSPIRGPEGNIEFLIHLVKGTDVNFAPDIKAVVAAAHGGLT
ncbi:MAG TPA: TlyA family RNA methyltransferase [Candidatus Acidoferrum sp.]|nr:TlyA family RNA methyltransferase [Candidatus Acidoferrum sp.]